MTPNEKLEAILHEHPTSPFLFIGSGFSQRYLGVPTWEGLLQHFCEGLHPYEYYRASSDSKLPRCASLIAKDFGVRWWTAPEFQAMRDKYKSHLIGSSSPLKIAISDLMASEFKLLRESRLTDELAALRTFNAEGIITTNWDGLIESLFPGYKVYIGQQSIVRKTPQNIGEIYKIHGCCTDPNSLVLTDEDYALFRDKQAYLAAKLITIFVEHPVLFIGYSVSDPNILDLLKSILRGLGSEEISKLQRNLIFIQRSKEGRPAGVKDTILVVDEVQLPVTNLIVDDFLPTYATLAQTKLKLPARLLRFCREQLYEIISSKEPSERLCLLNVDDITDKSDIEFVVGIGIGSQLAERGYLGVSTKDVFRSVIFEDLALDGHKVLEQTIPGLDFRNNYLPVFGFLRNAGIDRDHLDINESVKRRAVAGRDSFKTKGYLKQALRETSGKDFSWIIENLPPEKAAAFIPHLADDRIPLPELQRFAQQHFERAFSNKYSTFYRKLFCLYDFLKYNGKDFTP
jgi:hypothetical protein